MSSNAQVPPARRRLSRAAMIPLIALSTGYVGVVGPILCSEYLALRGDWETDMHRRVIGYPGITPSFSHASRPKNWIHDEGDKTLLWAGWDRKATRHTWFVVDRGQVPHERLSHPMGKDSIRAIDKPKLESGGGEVWNAMPKDTPVVAGEFVGVALAYPLGVLDKVLIVNDEIHKHPLLVLRSPFEPEATGVELFNPQIESKRVTMGYAGYLFNGRPLLYDRETQSLWVPGMAGLEAIAGVRKGVVLSRIARLDRTEWGTWSAAHPDGRLVAGAIRSDLKNTKP